MSYKQILKIIILSIVIAFIIIRIFAPNPEVSKVTYTDTDADYLSGSRCIVVFSVTPKLSGRLNKVYVTIDVFDKNGVLMDTLIRVSRYPRANIPENFKVGLYSYKCKEIGSIEISASTKLKTWILAE